MTKASSSSIKPSSSIKKRTTRKSSSDNNLPSSNGIKKDSSQQDTNIDSLLSAAAMNDSEADLSIDDSAPISHQDDVEMSDASSSTLAAPKTTGRRKITTNFAATQKKSSTAKSDNTTTQRKKKSKAGEGEETPKSETKAKQTKKASISASKPKAGSRDESSLKQLTKRFVELISESDDGTLDLNVAAGHLSVPKRRIYDITNVLEGIGLIEKKTKNIIQWLGSGIAVETAVEDAGVEDNAEIKALQEEIQTLQGSLEEWDTKVQSEQDTLKKLSGDPQYLKHAYVCTSDIKSIQSLQDRTIIAVRAPSGTTLTVPDPDEGMQFPQRRFQIFLHSQQDPINVLLLSDEMSGVQDATAQHQQQQLQQAQQQQHLQASTPQRVTISQATDEVVDEDDAPRTPPRHADFNIKTPPSHTIYQSPDNYGIGSIRQLSPPKPEPDYIYSESKFSVQELYE
mmetsp:Transcript_11615/g.43631  ORF Transcript_11615/g.43631 Transcript_11615/m.43631 type:complete len:454 (-) Transcript_11615:870-2231(-)|eukprot:CAMPEP_0117448852 /NCGR_PEP_ID=MMETSP0759-20121206/7626_1 /TAXON_ID=63605 /ORGANISM="Percolomonas cosmopolitus, Strain WS" /LENGTH=453 /DNA_ID=CAMNT_0005241275 /DNA_START=228 /DNA_END=1589 /DNA_ORIENTATION=-